METHPIRLLRTVDRMDSEDPSKTAKSVTISVSVSSNIANLRQQRPLPDVPEDIDDEPMPHFNDPNWDFQDSFLSLSISTDDEDPQRWPKMPDHTGAATESHISSWHIHDPTADLSLKDQVQLRVLSLPSCLAFRSSMSYPLEIHHTPRSGQPSRIQTTQQFQ